MFILEREDENRRVKSLLPWKQKNKETFVVLRGTTLNQFNLDFVSIVQKFKSKIYFLFMLHIDYCGT